ncbi:MAG: efflux RND transporter periplasmic adaptor subunit [Saprospiraceae bacterium]
MYILIKQSILILIIIFISSCNEKTDAKLGHDDHDHAHDKHGGHISDTKSKTIDGAEPHGDNEEEGIHLTKRQVEAIGLEYGTFRDIKISDFIKTTGTLGLPPKAYSSVSAKFEGFIKNVNKYVEGSRIQKGAIIGYLENPNLIEKQELFLSSSAELRFLQQEYNRQRELVQQQAGIERTVQKLSSDVEMKKAQVLGAQHYLDYLGINTSEVLAGQFIQRIPIVAPMTGFITTIDMHNGMFVKPEQQLLEIMSDKHLHLELDVFEKDISKVEEHQQVSYSIPALGTEIYLGEVHIIGREFNTDNKTVRVHGHLEGKKPKFIKDLFISAKIWLNDQKVQALPADAIMKDGPSYFVYYSVSGEENDHGEIEFDKLMVLPGTEDNGFVAIKLLDTLPQRAKIVTKGAYFIYAQSKYGEAVHEH